MGLQANHRLKSIGIGRWTVPALAAVLALFWWLNPPAIALLQPDSGAYISGSQFRGTIYPTIASAFDGATIGLQWLVALQLVSYFASAAAAALGIAAVFASSLAGLAFLVFVGANPELVKYCFTVLTESFSMCGAMLIVALGAYAIRARALWPLIGMAAVVVIGIDLRPTNWSWAPLVPLTAILARLGWAHFARGLTALLAGLVALSAAQPPGTVRQDFLALALFGKFAFYAEPGDHPFETAAAQETAEMRARLHLVGNFADAYALRTAYAEHLRYGVWSDFSARAPGDPATRLSQVLGLALRRPTLFVEDLLRDLRGFWTMPELMTPTEREARVAAYAGLPVSPLRVLEVVASARSPAGVWATRAILWVGFVVSLALLAAAPLVAFARVPIGWPLACLGALALWGNWTLIGSLHSALPRYALGAWPFLGLCLAGGLCVIGRALLRRA